MTENLSRLRMPEARARLLEMKADIAVLDAIVDAVDGSEPVGRRDKNISVPARLRLFLGAYPALRFHPSMLAEAIDAEESTVRQALSRLNSDGFVIRAGSAVYGASPTSGPLDAASARLLKGWY